MKELKDEKISMNKMKSRIEELSENLAARELRVKKLETELEDVKNKLQQEIRKNFQNSDDENKNESAERQPDEKDGEKATEIKELERQLEVTTRALDKKKFSTHIQK